MRRECADASVLSTADLDCSSSGTVRTAERLTDMGCCFSNIRSGSFNRLLSIPLVQADRARTFPGRNQTSSVRMSAMKVDAKVLYRSLLGLVSPQEALSHLSETTSILPSGYAWMRASRRIPDFKFEQNYGRTAQAKPSGSPPTSMCPVISRVFRSKTAT
jgi:hypothetical protein